MVLLVGRSREVASVLRPGTAGLVFIDADHQREAVEDSLRLYAPLLQAGGALAVHDYGHPLLPDVKTVIDLWCFATGFRVVEVVDTLAVVRPEAERLTWSI